MNALMDPISRIAAPAQTLAGGNNGFPPIDTLTAMAAGDNPMHEIFSNDPARRLEATKHAFHGIAANLGGVAVTSRAVISNYYRNN